MQQYEKMSVFRKESACFVNQEHYVWALLYRSWNRRTVSLFRRRKDHAADLELIVQSPRTGLQGGQLPRALWSAMGVCAVTV